jgi:hypothetical protein
LILTFYLTVSFRFFETIEIYFLLVGHTHGQIDQMFSCFAQYLKKFPAKTIPELCFGLHESYNNAKKRKAKKQTYQGEEKKDKPVNTQVIDTVVDVVTWLQTIEIPRAKNNMGLRKSHAFQLKLDISKDLVLVRSKEYSVSPDWLVFIFTFMFTHCFLVF